MDNQLNIIPSDLRTELLAIASIPREQITNHHRMIYEEVYRIVSGRSPGRGCSGICDTVWLIGRNVIKKLKLVHDAPSGEGKARVTKKSITFIYNKDTKKAERVKPHTPESTPLDKMTAKELKRVATERGLEFKKNATKATMIKLLS